MLKRRPALVAYIDRIAFIEETPLRSWCLKLVPQAFNLTYLLVDDGLRALAALYAEQTFQLPNLVQLEIFVQVSTSHQQANTLLRSLSSIESLTIWPRKQGGCSGQRMPLSAYNLDTLLPGAFPQVEHFGLRLGDISTCTTEEIASLIHCRDNVRTFTFDLPAEMHFDGLLRLFPTKLENFTIHCGLQQAKKICNDLSDADILPMLNDLPHFRVNRKDFRDESEPVDVPLRYARKAISGLLKRANFLLACKK